LRDRLVTGGGDTGVILGSGKYQETRGPEESPIERAFERGTPVTKGHCGYNQKNDGLRVHTERELGTVKRRKVKETKTTGGLSNNIGITGQ